MQVTPRASLWKTKIDRAMKFTLICLFLFIFCANALAISEKDYSLCLKNGEFSASDAMLNASWKNLKNLSSQKFFKIILDDQREWVKMGRDVEVNALRELLPNTDECVLYALSARGRALYFDMLSKFLHENPAASEREQLTHYYNLKPVWYLKEVYENFRKGININEPEDRIETTPDNPESNDSEMLQKIDDMVNELKTIRE